MLTVTNHYPHRIKSKCICYLELNWRIEVVFLAIERKLLHEVGLYNGIIP